MADAALGFVIEALLREVVALATYQFTRARAVKKELNELAKKLEMVQALLSYAQRKKVNEEAVHYCWLKKLRSDALEAQIVLDEFAYEVLRRKTESRKRDKLRRLFSSSNTFAFRSKLAHKVKDIMSSLDQVFPESDRTGLRQVEFINALPDLKENKSTHPFVDDSGIVGREDDTSEVMRMLTSANYPESSLPVITILGMGGQGKTTVAQLVYKNRKIKSHFDKKIWLCVSHDFNVRRLLNEMLESLTLNNPQLTIPDAQVRALKEQLSDKRYLLVLDDVWINNENEWDLMNRCLQAIGGSNGSKVLATTRSKDVASAMRTSGSHQLQVLSPEQSWELFEKRAFAEGGAPKTQELVHIGKRILERCGRLPLAINAIGNFLNSRPSESEWWRIENCGVWSVSGLRESVLSVIKRSYDDLPTLLLKQCFAYCAIFEKDTRIEKDMLIQLWMAQGLLNPSKETDLQAEDIGNEYFNFLLKSSLLQEAESDDPNNITHCKMHDLVHDVSLQVSKNYCFHVKDWKQERNEIEAVHLSITAGEGGMWESLRGIVPSNLRTLHLRGRKVFEKDLSANCSCLSALIVEDEDAEELPNWIGKMKHLRFLDISGTQIRKLPTSLKELYFLQTLRVNSLTVVSEDLSQKLINLRHICEGHGMMG